jgi:biotin carboxyl carrier protein
MTKKPKPKLADIKYDNAPEYITFVVHTAKYRTLPTQKFLNRKKWEPKNPKHILALIPGSIYKFYVKPGDNVKKDTLLFELDAMKMYNKILAPFDGKIKAIHVEEKQKVGKNNLILEFE